MDMLNDDAIRVIGQYTGILHGPKSYTNFALTCKRMKTLLLLPEDSDDVTVESSKVLYKQAKKAYKQDKSNNELKIAKSIAKEALREAKKSTVNDQTIIIGKIIQARVSDSKDFLLRWPKLTQVKSRGEKVRTLEQLDAYERCLTDEWALQQNPMGRSMTKEYMREMKARVKARRDSGDPAFQRTNHWVPGNH